ncbi:MAG: ABC transporter ATP-binding protein [Firmicutes bacterium]|nr:ABC transporter ATP-binding protein [Bacillota bacterium]
MALPSVKIEISKLSKSYETKKGVVRVLDDVSFSVYENEFLVILGPGQCGKTVLLNTIADIEQPDSGSVNFSGDSSVGFVFQRYALFNWKTVIKNVETPLRYRGASAEECTATARKYLDLVGLKDFESAYPAQLSGGMKQRVAIARAYTSGSDTIIMDEPFGALDAQTRYQMEEEVLKLRKTEKATVIFVTNNIEEAIYLGDRILLFSDKPSHIVNEFVPELPRPRNRTSPEFMALRDEITAQMDLSL